MVRGLQGLAQGFCPLNVIGVEMLWLVSVKLEKMYIINHISVWYDICGDKCLTV